MPTLRRIAAEIRRSYSSVPFLILMIGMLSYRTVRNDGWPWWLPVILIVVSATAGVLLGLHKARARRH